MSMRHGPGGKMVRIIKTPDTAVVATADTHIRHIIHVDSLWLKFMLMAPMDGEILAKEMRSSAPGLPPSCIGTREI